MKHLDRTGKIKTIALLLLALPNLFIGTKQQPTDNYVFLIFPFIFGASVIPILSKFNARISNRVISIPSWNDNPFNLKKLLSFYQFGAYFFVVTGLSMIIGTAIRFREFNTFGFMSISFGLGILAGIWLTIKWSIRKK